MTSISDADKRRSFDDDFGKEENNSDSDVDDKGGLFPNDIIGDVRKEHDFLSVPFFCSKRHIVSSLHYVKVDNYVSFLCDEES